MNGYIPPAVVHELIKSDALGKFSAALDWFCWGIVFGLFMASLLVAPALVVYVLLKHAGLVP